MLGRGDSVGLPLVSAGSAGTISTSNSLTNCAGLLTGVLEIIPLIMSAHCPQVVFPFGVGVSTSSCRAGVLGGGGGGGVCNSNLSMTLDPLAGGVTRPPRIIYLLLAEVDMGDTGRSIYASSSSLPKSLFISLNLRATGVVLYGDFRDDRGRETEVKVENRAGVSGDFRGVASLNAWVLLEGPCFP